MKLRVGDTVVVRTGKDKGKTGSITRILEKSDRVVVDGINKCTKHVKAKGDQPGDRVEFFAPLHVSNVNVQDPKTKKPTRVGYRLEGGGQKARIAKASGEALPTSADLRKAPKTQKK